MNTSFLWDFIIAIFQELQIILASLRYNAGEDAIFSSYNVQQFLQVRQII